MSNPLSSKIRSRVENVLTERDLFVDDLRCNIRLEPGQAVVNMHVNYNCEL